MFLHQIFYQGLKARIASWPTLVLGKWDISDRFFLNEAVVTRSFHDIAAADL